MTQPPVPARVIVIGAGLAGLAAARRLESAGARVTVCEQRPRPGGRLAQPGLFCTPASSPALVGLARELGDETTLERRRCDALATRAGRRDAFVLRSLVEARARLPWNGIQQRRLRRLLAWFAELLDPDDPRAGVRLDDRSVADFARVYLGRRRLARVYAPLFELAFGLDVRETSRLVLLHLMNASGDLSLQVVAGGDRLTASLAKELSDLRTSSPVAGIRDDGRAVRLADGDELETDAVLVATDAPAAKRLIPLQGPCEQTFFASAGTRPETRVAGRVASRGEGSLPSPLVAFPDAPILAGALGLSERVEIVARTSFAARAREAPDEQVLATVVRDARASLAELRSFEPDGAPTHSERSDFAPGSFRRAERMREEQRARLASRPVLYGGADGFGPHPEAALRAGLDAARLLLGA